MDAPTTTTGAAAADDQQTQAVVIRTLASVLFPDDPQELGPEQLNYLSRLGTQGLESLMGEVARVNEELAIVEHGTRDMASQNYQIFVQSAQTTNLLKKSLSEAKHSVEALSSSTFPSFKAKTDSFQTVAAGFQKDQEIARGMFEKEGDLGAVLDMAWIIRRCLTDDTNKMLPEAIKILHTVMDYKSAVSGDDSIVPPAMTETITSVLQLQTQIQSALLSKLSSPSISLSDCLQTIQLLRHFFPNDKALRFRFLQSRVMNPSLPFDSSRSWIFDTLTQHRAAFGQDSSHLLATFISLQMNSRLTDVLKQLDHQQTLDSLLTNVSYFGESLARVGADLRGLAVPLFSEFLLKKAGHDLLQAELNFSRNLHSFNISTCLIQERMEKLGVGMLDENVLEGSIDSGGSSLQPPHQLLAFHPLALYCNEVLNILNVLIKCPLPQGAGELSRKLGQSVTKVGHELEAWGQGEFPAWDLKERNLFYRIRNLYEQLLVPHLDKCFRLVFPLNEISALTGMSVKQCAEILEVRYKRPVSIVG